jgi:subtilisin family serine protease
MRTRLEALQRELGCVSSEELLKHSDSTRLQEVVSGLGLDQIRVLRFPEDTDLPSTIDKLRTSGLVEYVEPNYYVIPGTSEDNSGELPNDPGFEDQWGLRNLGLSVGGFPALLNADIKALEAWKLTTGSPDLVVAVCDTGVDITHPDLAANIYTNNGEIAGNGRDDDGNGYIDDVHGYNVAEDSPDVTDILGHGTQMSGIIAGVINNEMGISGVSQSKLLPVRFFKRTGSNLNPVDGTVADAARSIAYAIAAGASIINASWTTTLPGGSSSQALEDAVKTANEAGVLMVCISGNAGVNIDFSPVYPANYRLPNQIVAGASDFTDWLWHQYGAPSNVRSSYGVRTVDLAAPGELVYTTAARGDCPLCSPSTTPEDWYSFVDGTSASAAFVSGVAALVKTRYPDDNLFLLRRRIIESVDERDSLRDYVATSGRLNAASALSVELTTSHPSLNKVKYKIGAEKMILFGEGIAEAAYVIVGNGSYATRVKGEQIIATVPATRLPIGTPVPIRILNPDGGVSPPRVFTR